MSVTFSDRDGLSHEEVLIDGNELQRCMARFAASCASDEVVTWLGHEIDERGTNPAIVLHALAILQMQTYASLAAQVMLRSGDGDAIALYRAVIDEQRMAEHIERARLAFSAGGTKQ